MAESTDINPGSDGAGVPYAEDPINEDNIAGVEIETIHKVSHALSVLETALSEWEASEEKPEDLVMKFEGYRQFHNDLEEWEKRMLLSAGEHLDFFSRVDRLRDFVFICKKYAR